MGHEPNYTTAFLLGCRQIVEFNQCASARRYMLVRVGKPHAAIGAGSCCFARRRPLHPLGSGSRCPLAGLPALRCSSAPPIPSILPPPISQSGNVGSAAGLEGPAFISPKRPSAFRSVTALAPGQRCFQGCAGHTHDCLEQQAEGCCHLRTLTGTASGQTKRVEDCGKYENWDTPQFTSGNHESWSEEKARPHRAWLGIWIVSTAGGQDVAVSAGDEKVTATAISASARSKAQSARWPVTGAGSRRYWAPVEWTSRWLPWSVRGASFPVLNPVEATPALLQWAARHQAPDSKPTTSGIASSTRT